MNETARGFYADGAFVVPPPGEQERMVEAVLFAARAPLSGREIAERLYLSHHTVSQDVKRVYRKLGVDSRVALTRELLRPRPRLRKSRPSSPSR